MFKKMIFMWVFIVLVVSTGFPEDSKYSELNSKYAIQSSVVILENQDDDRVVLIGTPHFGTKDYYKIIKGIIKNFDIVIHEDLIGFPRIMLSYYVCARLFRVMYEPDVFDYDQEKYVVADISPFEMNEMLNYSDVDAQNMQSVRILNTVGLVKRFQFMKTVIDYYNYVTVISDGSDDPLIMTRIPVQIEAILQAGTCAVITGEAHIKQLLISLTGNGYVITGKYKLNPFM